MVRSNLENAAYNLVEEIRHRIEKKCRIPDDLLTEYSSFKRVEGGHMARVLRQHPFDNRLDLECVVLADIEHNLVEIADGNIHELIKEAAWQREKYHSQYGRM